MHGAHSALVFQLGLYPMHATGCWRRVGSDASACVRAREVRSALCSVALPGQAMRPHGVGAHVRLIDQVIRTVVSSKHDCNYVVVLEVGVFLTSSLYMVARQLG